MTRLLPLLALALVALAWLGSGVMFVDAGQKALVYRFGAVQLQGRLPGARPRGCSLTVEEAAKGLEG